MFSFRPVACPRSTRMARSGVCDGRSRVFGEFLAVPDAYRDLQCLQSPMEDVMGPDFVIHGAIPVMLWSMALVALAFAFPAAAGAVVAIVLAGLLVIRGNRARREAGK